MIAVGVLIGFVITAPVFFALGVFTGNDRRVHHHERCDISEALRRSVR